MTTPSAYTWLKARGYWLTRRDDPRAPTHLMLDGGKACVPDDMHGIFLNAYAISVVTDGPGTSSIVELRTPVFRLFLDVDARWSQRPPPDVLQAPGVPAVLEACMRTAAEAFPDQAARAVVSASSEATCDQDTWKHGVHLTWPDVYVTADTALAFRKTLLERLGQDHPFAAPLDSVVDSCVFRANGLRMAWSGKGRGAAPHYVPVATATLDDDDRLALERVGPVTGVSAVRQYVSSLSVRCPSALASPTVLVGEAPADEPGCGAPVCKSLAAYPHDALTALDAALPVQFAGQRFAGLMSGEACFMLRSTSRWCGNLGRAHRTNNVYFVLTRKGVHQRCYCRCETTEGRKYGLCKDYCSETWPVPEDVVRAFFQDPPAGVGGVVGGGNMEALARMPSQVMRDSAGISSLLARRMASMQPAAAKRKKRA